MTQLGRLDCLISIRFVDFRGLRLLETKSSQPSNCFRDGLMVHECLFAKTWICGRTCTALAFVSFVNK